MVSVRRLVPGPVRRSYVLKFGAFIAVIGLTVGAIGFLATDQIQTQTRADADDALRGAAEREAEAVADWDRRNELGVAAAAGRPALRSGDPGSVAETLRAIAEDDSLPEAQALHYVAPGGTVVATTAAGDPGEVSALPGGDVWGVDPAVEAGETRTSEAYTVDGTPVVAYLHGVERADGDLRTLVYVVPVASFGAATADGDANGSVVYLVDPGPEKGRVLYDSAGSAVGSQYAPGTRNTLLTVLGEDFSGVFRTGSTPEPLAGSVPGAFRGESYVISRASVPGEGPQSQWVAIVHRPASEVYARANRIRAFGFVATIVAVIAIGGFGILLGRNTASSIDRLRAKSEQMGQQNLDVDFSTTREDEIGQLYRSMADMRDDLRKQIADADRAREEAEQAREEAERRSQHLREKAGEYSEVMRAVARGNLDRRMDPSDRDEAMREVAEEFNEMIAELEANVARLKGFADEVAASSEEVTASSQEIRSASERVTESVEEISDDADRQYDALRSVDREMSDLSTTVSEIADLSNDAADLAEQTARTGREGREAAQEAIAGMNRIERDAATAVEEIERLEEQMEQIDELTEFIGEVADQTNMLALNANIEASRANTGAGGEGFGVVADEVKELASEAKEAAADIEDQLETIKAQTDRTADGVRATGDRIARNTESIRNAVEALDEIAGLAEETNEGVQEISAATEQQDASTREVVETVGEATEISERTSEQAEVVADAAREQTSAIAEVSRSTEDLSGQAASLSEALGNFTTGGTDRADLTDGDAHAVDGEG